MVSHPSRSSAMMASRTGMRLTPRRRAISSCRMRSPCRRSPLKMSERMWTATRSPLLRRSITGSGANPWSSGTADTTTYTLYGFRRAVPRKLAVAVDVPHVLELAPTDRCGAVAAFVLPAHQPDDVHHRRQVLEAHVVLHLADRFEGASGGV